MNLKRITLSSSAYASTLLDLHRYEGEATRLLSQVPDGSNSAKRKNVRMRAFRCNTFGCPLLHRTLAGKRSVRGIVIPQDWGNELETLDAAINYLIGIQNGEPSDDTSRPLFAPESPWLRVLTDPEGFIATNAVWGLRPDNVKMSGYLGDETHQAGFLIWGNIARELLERNPRLIIIPAGNWAELKRIGFDREVPASEFFRAWKGGWLTDPQARALADTLATSGATVITRFHPSSWSKKYDGKFSPIP
jgi:hypothetical protein